MWYRASVFLACFLGVSVVSAATWEVRPAPAGNGAKWAAAISNEAGHTLTITRRIGRGAYEAYATLALAGGMRFDAELPTYRIDQGAEQDPAIVQRAGENLGLRWASLEPGRATWRVWTSPDTQLRATDELAPWIQGAQVHITFKDADGKTRTTAFSLRGSADAIRTAITGPMK